MKKNKKKYLPREVLACFITGFNQDIINKPLIVTCQPTGYTNREPTGYTNREPTGYTNRVSKKNKKNWKVLKKTCFLNLL